MNNRIHSIVLRILRVFTPFLLVWAAFLLPTDLWASKIDFNHKVLPQIVIKNNPLKLVGTAVTGDFDQNIAVIEDPLNHRQWSFHEGDRAGNILIKTIRRDHIVIDSGHGDRTVKLKGFLGKGAPPLPERKPGPSVTSINRVSSRMRQVVVDQGEAQNILSNPQALLDQITVMPARFFNREMGFRIADFEKGSILSKMGLRSGDLILAVNDHEITGPEEAALLFETLREEGDIDLTVRRRARTYHINLLIQ